MYGFRICLQVSALLSCLRTVDGGRARFVSTNGEAESACTQEVVQNTCQLFGTQPESAMRRLAQAFNAEEEDVVDLLSILGAATDDFSCEPVCELAASHVPDIFGFSFPLFAKLANLRVSSALKVSVPPPVHLDNPMGTPPPSIAAEEDMSTEEIVQESLRERQKEIERGEDKIRSRQILLDKLLRAMFGDANDGDVEHKKTRNESVALVQHSEIKETAPSWLPWLQQDPPRGPTRPPIVWKTTFPRPKDPVSSNSKEHIAKYKEYVDNAAEKVKVVLSQMGQIKNVQASLKKWFHTTESDMQPVFNHVRKIMMALLKVLGNVKFLENQNSCGATTLAGVHIAPAHMVEGVQVCGTQEEITDGRFLIYICPYFWYLWHFEPTATILHEASHVLCTQDHAYCELGFQCHLLSAGKARNNADNYAYFVNEVYWKKRVLG
eukprot:TRINITY_DN24591_c0_g1_i1.p1 TRINITY_DN24591_c0_g1~~TRINITY_DN24591_c0_g1_i1.p1  ORF type:complete len:437 (-),score=60.34 TRINITY_DN24591_c0_g1_i1:56-1366(-)